MLNINKQAENGKLVIALEGRLDTTTSPVLEVELKSSLDGVTELIMDFEKLEYISSAGLRFFMQLKRESEAKGGSIRITHLNEDVDDIFRMSGFHNLFTIE